MAAIGATKGILRVLGLLEATATPLGILLVLVPTPTTGAVAHYVKIQ